jgi:hypothetical protein
VVRLLTRSGAAIRAAIRAAARAAVRAAIRAAAELCPPPLIPYGPDLFRVFIPAGAFLYAPREAAGT